MPHQCVRCSTLYPDGSEEILKGCDCGARLFFFIKKKHLEESKEVIQNLTTDDKEQMEEDISEIIGLQKEEIKPVVLDFESIRILQPGKYELDLVHLFKKDPLVFRLEEGKYMIDIQQAFQGGKQ
ncbi:MAG: hypothetical protein CMH61_02305 [Nanoarchaeota archaeon]|nr:hypothetical protein [Nanoarchaeota archaeon]|tara:strand:+ start:500 stop:874 length:375 start_codon:yes stop_codon:yes gene_type:complete